jgi:hypothetical protein
VVIEHPSLRAEFSENPADVNCGGSCDEGQIASYTRVVYREDVEAP